MEGLSIEARVDCIFNHILYYRPVYGHDCTNTLILLPAGTSIVLPVGYVDQPTSGGVYVAGSGGGYSHPNNPWI